MTTPLHTELAAGRWRELTLAEQLGNIGSEVSRAMRWRERGNSQIWPAALDRLLELFDLTIADRRWRHGLGELTRAREVVCDFFAGDNVYGSTPQNLQSYFDHFALVARQQAGQS